MICIFKTEKSIACLFCAFLNSSYGTILNSWAYFCSDGLSFVSGILNILYLYAVHSGINSHNHLARYHSRVAFLC